MVGALQDAENASSWENDSFLRNNQVHCTSVFNGKVITERTKLTMMVFPPSTEGPLLLTKDPMRKEETFHFNFLLMSIFLSLAILSHTQNILLENKVLLYGLNISFLKSRGWSR